MNFVNEYRPALDYHYRISKYNPRCRTKEGGYCNDEWTSNSDIGLYFNGIQFTASEYFIMEDKYWETIRYLLELCNIKKMKVFGLKNRNRLQDYFTQNKFYFASSLSNSLQDKKNISLSEVEIIFRLCLRNEIECQLKKDGGTYISFGSDFTINFGTNIRHTIDYTQIPEGIFIETEGLEVSELISNKDKNEHDNVLPPNPHRQALQ